MSRLSFDVTERKLRREFEEYGPIKRIRLVHDKNSGGWRAQVPVMLGGQRGGRGADAVVGPISASFWCPTEQRSVLRLLPWHGSALP